MSQENNHPSSKRMNPQALGMALGLVLGWLVGFLIDNPIIFSGGGMIIGLAIGTAVDKRNQQER